MKTAYLSVLLLTVTIPFSTHAQIFERIYPSSVDRSARDVMKTSDGGYLITGFTNNSNPSDCDLYVMKTDANGNMVWDTAYGGGRPDYAYSMTNTDDGSFIIAGFTQSFGPGDYDMYLLKVDHNGKLIKQVNFGTAANEEGHQVIRSADGNFLVVGTSGLNAADSKVMLVKVDANLNKLGEYYYDGGSGQEFGNTIDKTPDGGYIIGGQTFSQGDAGDAYVIKLNGDLSRAWEKHYGWSLAQEVMGIVSNDDGSFVIAIRDSIGTGATQPEGNIDVTMMKLNSTGDNVIWKSTFGWGDKDTPKTMRKFNGGYLVAAISRSNLPAPQMWIIYVNDSGAFIWGREYGDFYEHDHCHIAKPSDDGGILAAGHQRKPVMKIYFLKLDAQGYVGIKEDQLTLGYNLFPNPSNGEITVSTGKYPLVDLSVSDVMGREMMNLTADALERSGNRLSFENHPAGIYFINIRTASGVVTRKLIKE